jgi:hypothetical protein
MVYACNVDMQSRLGIIIQSGVVKPRRNCYYARRERALRNVYMNISRRKETKSIDSAPVFIGV